MTINDRYLDVLSIHPLLTKMVTSGVLSSLNEIIASTASRQYQKKKIVIFGKTFELSHPLSSKIGSMIIYGTFLSTPVAHYYYGYSHKLFGAKQSPRTKLLQLATTLATLSPFLSAVFVGWLSIINSYKYSSKGVLAELKKIAYVVKLGLKNNFWLVYRSSAATSIVALTIAQHFVPPELWVVFTNFVYFIVGTIQNTKIKIKQRKEKKSSTNKSE